MQGVVFAGVSALEQGAQRQMVLRIPEVSMHLKKAQAILEARGKKIDLNMFLSGSETLFLSNLSARTLLAAIVQWSLYQRYLKFHAVPEFLMGPSNGDSALRVALGELSFEELVVHSQFSSDGGRRLQLVQSGDDLQLAGMALTEYRVFKKVSGTDQSGKVQFEAVKEGSEMELAKLVLKTASVYSLSSLVNIGPGGTLALQLIQQKLRMVDVPISESIELDPLMSALWEQQKQLEVGLA